MWKKIVLIIVLVAVSTFAFLTWYKFHYSMEVAQSFDVIAQNPEHKLLIATQGSDFKNAVVTDVIEALKSEPVSIKVIDVSGLASINVDDWNAIVLLHTWESRKPQADAEQFIERHRERNKIIVLTTSGEGDLKMDGVDALTSASVMSEVSMHVSKIVQRIDGIIINIK